MFTLTPADKTAAPGGTVTFTGTLTNRFTQRLYFNGFTGQFTQSSAGTVDTNSFFNFVAPDSLDSNRRVIYCSRWVSITQSGRGKTAREIEKKTIMAMNDPSQLGESGPSSGDLDGLLEILGNGITNLSPEAALPILQNWQAQLQALPSPNAQIVAGDLAQLYDVLGSEGGMGAGTDIGSLLVTLAGDVRGLIDETGDTPGLSDKLTRLASILESQGTTLNDSGA